MKDFSPDEDHEINIIEESNYIRYSVEEKELPLPEIVYFILIYFLEFQPGYRGEKTHWIISFKYKGYRFSLSSMKLGLYLYISHKQKKNIINPREILGKFKKATLYFQKKILEPLAQNQIKDGNVTIINKFHQLNGMYKYFREQGLYVI